MLDVRQIIVRNDGGVMQVHRLLRNGGLQVKFGEDNRLLSPPRFVVYGQVLRTILHLIIAAPIQYKLQGDLRDLIGVDFHLQVGQLSSRVFAPVQLPL